MKKEGIPFDGFGSVVEMLTRADAAFREKILSNLRRRDPDLVRRLEAQVKNNLALASASRSASSDSRAILERSQQHARTRQYGQ